MHLLKKKLVIALFLLLSMFLAACGANESTSSGDTQTDAKKEETKKLIFALDQQPSDTWVKASEKFAELVKEKTNGSIEIKVHHSGTLGSQKEILEGILNGTVHGSVNLEPLTYWAEEIDLFGIPYLFEDQEHLSDFMNSEYSDEIKQKLIDSGFRPLTYFDRPPRHLTSNKPVEKLADLKGLNIRVPETATAPPAFKAMGASPTAMAFSELYNALDTGVIDAQENPIPTIYNNNLHEVQEYFAYTYHQFQPVYFIIGEEIYQSLSEEQKKAIDEAAEEVKKYESEILAKDMEVMVTEMEKDGVKFTEPDVKEFAEAAQKAYAGYDQLMKDWVEKVQSLRK